VTAAKLAEALGEPWRAYLLDGGGWCVVHGVGGEHEYFAREGTPVWNLLVELVKVRRSLFHMAAIAPLGDEYWTDEDDRRFEEACQLAGIKNDRG